MRKSNPLVSVIITTYNRYELLKITLQKVYEQSYTNLEVIVSDDCSSDLTCKIVENFPGITYIKTPQNLGYAKNSQFAFSYATGEYVIFLSDDDTLCDYQFISSAIEIFEKEEVDSVFGRTGTKYLGEIIVNQFPFQKNSSTQEFITQLIQFKFHFLDYFSFSSFVFKRSYFSKIKPFESLYEYSSSVDISNIVKYLLITKSIGFVDRVVYLWQNSTEDSLSGKSREDISLQTLQVVSGGLDIYQFCEDKLLCIDLCNHYLENAFSMILSYKEQLNNTKNFQYLLEKLAYQSIYIYGRGWAGIQLKQYIKGTTCTFKFFIDDLKKNCDDTISFQDFLALDEDATVVVATYKYKELYSLTNKLRTVKSIRVFDLYGNQSVG